MNIEQKPSFYRIYKKLHKSQKADVNTAIKDIISNPKVGVAKMGDLLGFYVYKFKSNNQELLLAYTYDEENILITLHALGSHQNFYRGLKKTL